ncbi:hypothetical protein CR513_11918, partial [Mucuna pruriens]
MRDSGFSQPKERRERKNLDLEVFGVRHRACTIARFCKRLVVFTSHIKGLFHVKNLDVSGMLGMNIMFEDEILGLLLLNSLPKTWETFKLSITNSTPNGVVSFQMVNGSILNEEMRRKAQGSSSQSEVVVIENRGEVRKREKKIAKENKGKKGKSKENDDDDCVTIVIGDDLVILREFESVNLVSDESMWIIDNDVTLHITPRKEFFTSYTSGDFGVLKMANDGVTKVISVGDVCLKTSMGMKFWVYTLKSKDQVLEKFKHFQTLVERQSERMNKTLIERVRCILSEARLLKYFWGEALYTVAHVINLSPAVALNTEVSDKIWFGKDVKYDHL